MSKEKIEEKEHFLKILFSKKLKNKSIFKFFKRKSK